MVHHSLKLGKNNFIGPFCNIEKNVVIGEGNILEAYVSIGTPAEHRTEPTKGGVLIGNNNKIKEFVTINSALDGWTIVGSDCFIMTKVHIGHDACIESEVTLSCATLIGGHSHVMWGANMGLASVLHQKRVIGAYAMIGMNSTVTKSIKPFATAFGSPCLARHSNSRGLTLRGYTDEEIANIEKYIRGEMWVGSVKVQEVVNAFHTMAKKVDPTWP